MARHRRNNHQKGQTVASLEVNVRNLTSEDIQSDPMKFGKPVNDGSGIECKLCKSVLKAYSADGETRGNFKRHLGMLIHRGKGG